MADRIVLLSRAEQGDFTISQPFAAFQQTPLRDQIRRLWPAQKIGVQTGGYGELHDPDA